MSHETLMENAGYQVASFLRRRYDRDVSFLFCIGKGNDGGDGLIVARLMHQWVFEVKVCVVSRDVRDIVGKKHYSPTVQTYI